MKNEEVDISLIVTFHNEGILAQMTLNSIERCRLYALEYGIKSEYIWIMDNIDEETKRVLDNYHIDQNLVKKLEVSHGDAGASRNSGIEIANADIIAIFDGDDYYSINWIERSVNYLNEYGDNTILHPEFMVTFDSMNIFGRQIDQKEQFFSEKGLITHNFWTSAWTIAKKTVYLDNPYVATYASKTGYGYEDWHWNCETIAKGYIHRLSLGTVGFYRRKVNSRLVMESNESAILRKSKIFDKSIFNKEYKC